MGEKGEKRALAEQNLQTVQTYRETHYKGPTEIGPTDKGEGEREMSKRESGEKDKGEDIVASKEWENARGEKIKKS